jgi:hypothetical protein
MRRIIKIISNQNGGYFFSQKISLVILKIGLRCYLFFKWNKWCLNFIKYFSHTLKSLKNNIPVTDRSIIKLQKNL